MFLIGLLLTPLAELSEILDQTQIALAGWRKVLGVLATPLDVPEPDPGRSLPAGALTVAVDGLSLRLPRRRPGAAGRRRPAARRADGRGGRRDRVGQDDVRQAAVPAGRPDRPAPSGWAASTCGRSHPAERRRAVRLVPQDGFLFDGTVADNVRVGRVDGDGAWPTTTPSGGRSPPSGSTGGSTSCRSGWTRRSASGAATCRSASASWWRWPGPSSATRGCWCSTRRPARSTPRPSGR